MATNTNLYAVEMRFSVKERRQRAWHETSPAELKAFVGVLIYMGLYKSYRETQYWNQDTEEGPIHTFPTHMSLCRYQAMKRYLHIAPSLWTNTWECESIEEELGTVTGSDQDQPQQRIW